MGMAVQQCSRSAAATRTLGRFTICLRQASASPGSFSAFCRRSRWATSGSSLSTARRRAPSTGSRRKATSAPIWRAAAAAELTSREREICATIGPELKRRGLLFAGIDVIDGYLTEINVTSPTGIRSIKQLGGPDLACLIWNAIEAKLGEGLASAAEHPQPHSVPKGEARPKMGFCARAHEP